MMPGGYSSTTNYGTGQAVQPAGSGQTVGSSDSGGVTFWSPSKYAMIVDSRPVPGMGVVSTDPNGPGGFFGGVMPGGSVTTTTQHPNSPYMPGLFGDTFTQANPPTTSTSTFGPSLMTTGNQNGMPFTQTQSTSLGQAMNQLLTFGSSADPTGVQTLQDQLIKGGFLDPTKSGFNYGAISGTKDPTYSAWYQLLETSIRTGTDYNAILQARVARDAGKKYEDALALQQAKVKKQQDAAAAALLPRTVNRTATQISDPLTAQNLMTTMLTNELGRAPDPAEITQFTQALQTAQAANPTMTTAVTDPGQVQDKSAVQTGGFDSGQFTQNYIDQNFSAEKAAVGGATGFYQAALDTLGAGGRGY